MCSFVRLLLLLVLLAVLTNGQEIIGSADEFYSKYPAPKLHPLQDQHVIEDGDDWYQYYQTFFQSHSPDKYSFFGTNALDKQA
jgi:hypothetical protein